MNEGAPLSGAEIRSYLDEVAESLPREGHQHVVVVVGGALLALHGIRSGTRDVDSVQRLDDELRSAVRGVASRRGLAPEWLNDHAAGFIPATFEIAECEVLIDSPALLVLGAPLKQVFLMKMFAGRAPDHEDLVSLWPLVDLDPEQAVDLFWKAYPAAPADDYLIAWVRDIAAEADSRT